jgi:hypothetical protein
MERLSSPMTLVWLIYFSFAELLSLLPSQESSCILISEEANTENYSGDYACASMHEAGFRFCRFIWENAGHDNVLAFGTIAVSVFTYTLWRSTNKLWEAGERQSGLTKDSIDLARGEFNASHRPRMRLKHAWFVDQTAWRLNGPLEINLDFVNVGNANALITWVNYQSILIPIGRRLPPRPPYDEYLPGQENARISRFRTNVVLASGITLPRTVCDGILDAQEVHDILWGIRQLYLIGTIEYWHAAGHRQTAFCRRLTYESYPPPDLADVGRFEIVDDPDYEYQD